MTSTSFGSAVNIASSLLFRSGAQIRLKFISTCILDFAVVALSVAAPAILKYAIDALGESGDTKTVLWLAAGYGIVWTASEVLLRVRAYVTTSVLEQLKLDAIKRLCINSIFRLPVRNSPEISSGAFSAKMNQLSYSLPIFVDGLAWQVFPLLIRLILSIGVLVAFAPVIYPVMLMVSVLAFITLSVMTFSVIGSKQGDSNLSMQRSSWKILDALHNKQVTIAHAAEQYEMDNIDRSLTESKKINLSTMAYTQMVSGTQVFLLGAGLMAITLKGVSDVSDGVLTIGEFIQINAYMLQFLLPISYFGIVLSGIKRASVSLSENAKELASHDLGIVTQSDKCSKAKGITVKNLSVSFGGAETIRDLDFVVQPGECVAIVGSSGAGKSTLIKSIIGLCAPQSGEIYIGDEKVTETSIRSLRHSIGYVPQDSQLFDRSLRDNIFGEEKDQEFELCVLRLSGLSDAAIKETANHTCNQLSGGEKQRVAFARALAREPVVLILDEPSSSLDAHTKEIITSSVLNNLHNVTRILVTHDLKQASRADRLVVMADGRVIESGTHEQLINFGGWYSKHWVAH